MCIEDGHTSKPYIKACFNVWLGSVSVLYAHHHANYLQNNLIVRVLARTVCQWE